MSMTFGQLMQAAEEAGGSFDTLPEAEYNVEIVEAEYASASTGKPMIKVTFKVMDGPHAGRKLWNNFVMTTDNPNALRFFITHMKNLGVTDQWFASASALPPEQALRQLAPQLVGCRAQVTVKHREFEGTTRENIKAVKRYNGPIVSATGPPATATGLPPATTAADPVTPPAPAPPATPDTPNPAAPPVPF